jgi:uncharacterized membrane protein YeaQ/YmgE (transglycosylase-associated protein family)
MPLSFALILAGVLAMIFAGYIATELHQNGTLGFPLDDPWIHLTFARNLARGWGLAFNQGEPVQGSSAPLWTLLLAFFHRFTKNAAVMVWIAKILDAALLYVAALFACRIVMYLTRQKEWASPPWAGLAAGLALVSLSHSGWAMVSGMEVTLAAALALGGIYYHVAGYRGWRAYLPWILFVLAVYSRPESFGLVAFLTIDILVRRLAFKRRVLFWRGLGVYVLAVVPYFLLNLALTHSLFPQTYLAKTGRTSLFAVIASSDMTQLQYLLFKMPPFYLRGFVTHLWRANPVLVLLAGIGLYALIAEYVRRKGQASLLLPLVIVLYAPLVGMVAPFVAPAFQYGRYIGNPVAAAIVAAVIGAVFVLGLLHERRVRIATLAGILALALFNTVSTAIATADNTARAESSINRMQVAVGKWLEYGTPAQAVVACNDVGAIGYFANRRVVDLLGLVTPEVQAYRLRYSVGNENYGVLDYIKAKKPDYLAIFPNWFPNLEGAKFLTPVYVADLKDNTASEYDFFPVPKTIAGILVTGLAIEPIRSTMIVYRADWGVVGK